MARTARERLLSLAIRALDRLFPGQAGQKLLLRLVERHMQELIDRATKEPPRAVDAQIMGRLAKAVERLGQPEKAIDILRKRVLANPRDAEALNDLGMLLEAKGELYAACFCYVDALEARFEYPEAEFNLVCIRQRLFGGNL
jgi:tetratricopeptide (TPR) repeat protein